MRQDRATVEIGFEGREPALWQVERQPNRIVTLARADIDHLLIWRLRSQKLHYRMEFLFIRPE
jgi:hypothetical protein